MTARRARRPRERKARPDVPPSVERYILAQPPRRRPLLRLLRKVVRDALPESGEEVKSGAALLSRRRGEGGVPLRHRRSREPGVLPGRGSRRPRRLAGGERRGDAPHRGRGRERHQATGVQHSAQAGRGARDASHRSAEPPRPVAGCRPPARRIGNPAFRRDESTEDGPGGQRTGCRRSAEMPVWGGRLIGLPPRRRPLGGAPLDGAETRAAEEVVRQRDRLHRLVPVPEPRGRRPRARRSGTPR